MKIIVYGIIILCRFSTGDTNIPDKNDVPPQLFLALDPCKKQQLPLWGLLLTS